MDATSTKNSRRALVYLVGLLFLVAILLEAVGHEFSHVSRLQRRVTTDYANAVKITPSDHGTPTMLVVGNSLALEGINFPEFEKGLAGSYVPSRFVVEQTSYRDWYYGLRRLFKAGARPKVLVLCLATQDFVVEGVRWGYFAHYLLDLRDFPSLVRTEHLNPTIASTYFFASLSTWIGTKTEIRNWLLVKTLPDIVKFGNLFPDLPPMPPANVVRNISNIRFSELKEICAPYNTRLVLVIPPNLSSNDSADIVMDAGRQAGITVLDTYRAHEMLPQYFRDGYHLTDEGALLFTPRLAAQLRDLP